MKTFEIKIKNSAGKKNSFYVKANNLEEARATANHKIDALSERIEGIWEREEELSMKEKVRQVNQLRETGFPAKKAVDKVRGITFSQYLYENNKIRRLNNEEIGKIEGAKSLIDEGLTSMAAYKKVGISAPWYHAHKEQAVKQKKEAPLHMPFSKESIFPIEIDVEKEDKEYNKNLAQKISYLKLEIESPSYPESLY